MIYGAMIHLMVRRLGKAQTQT